MSHILFYSDLIYIKKKKKNPYKFAYFYNKNRLIPKLSNQNHLLHKSWQCSWSQYRNQMVQEISLELQEPWQSSKIKSAKNQARGILTVSGELTSSQSTVVLHLHDLGKKYLELPNCVSHCQNIAKLFIYSSINLKLE